MSLLMIVVFLVILTICGLGEVADKGHSDIMDRNGGPGCCVFLTIVVMILFIFCVGCSLLVRLLH